MGDNTDSASKAVDAFKEEARHSSKADVDSTTGTTTAGSIASLLKSSGPVVKCVLLKHMRSSGRDVHPHLDQSVVAQKMRQYNSENSISHDDDNDTKPSAVPTTTTEATDLDESPQKHREVLTELIEELEVDTTPGLNGVQDVLGGNGFTFIGQYPDEGIILMARADQFHDDIDEIDTLSIRELKSIIHENPDMMIELDLTKVTDKSDLIQAVKNTQFPLNPHRLQPPFDECSIRGDILLMRVTDNTNDDEENEAATAMSKAIEEITTATSIPNDEFFLDYTKEEYIKFASRTDIVAPPMEEDDDEEENYDDENDAAIDHEGDENEEDDDDEDGDDDEEDDEEYTADDCIDEEDDKRVLLSLILGEVIKTFRQENGRGPDSEELLDLRAQVAEKLNLKLPPPAATIPESDLKKRKAVDDGTDDQQALEHSPSPKKVKFTPEILAKEDENDNIKGTETNVQQADEGELSSNGNTNEDER